MSSRSSWTASWSSQCEVRYSDGQDIQNFFRWSIAERSTWKGLKNPGHVTVARRMRETMEPSLLVVTIREGEE